MMIIITIIRDNNNNNYYYLYMDNYNNYYYNIGITPSIIQLHNLTLQKHISYHSLLQKHIIIYDMYVEI